MKPRENFRRPMCTRWCFLLMLLGALLAHCSSVEPGYYRFDPEATVAASNATAENEAALARQLNLSLQLRSDGQFALQASVPNSWTSFESPFLEAKQRKSHVSTNLTRGRWALEGRRAQLRGLGMRAIDCEAQGDRLECVSSRGGARTIFTRSSGAPSGAADGVDHADSEADSKLPAALQANEWMEGDKLAVRLRLGNKGQIEADFRTKSELKPAFVPSRMELQFSVLGWPVGRSAIEHEGCNGMAVSGSLSNFSMASLPMQPGLHLDMIIFDYRCEMPEFEKHTFVVQLD